MPFFRQRGPKLKRRAKRFALPEGEVLVSHSPPQGVLDRCYSAAARARAHAGANAELEQEEDDPPAARQDPEGKKGKGKGKKGKSKKGKGPKDAKGDDNTDA